MRALDSEDNYNLHAKTLFLLGILDMRKDGVYFDDSNSVKLGPLSRLGKRSGFDQSENRWNDVGKTLENRWNDVGKSLE